MFRKAFFALVVVALFLPLGAGAQAAWQTKPGAGPIPQFADERSGVLPARPGQYLRLVTDSGHVIVSARGGSAAQVTYRVRVEADSRQPGAAALVRQFNVTATAVPTGVQITGSVPWQEFRGRISVRFEVNVPAQYNLDIVTQAGNIHVGDIKGRVSLVTAGGNITTGRVVGDARLDTQGGHITAGDIAGSLAASTQGGHITVGSVQGNGTLETGGGHIRVVSIQGAARLETVGGDVRVERAGQRVVAISGGGQISFGEAAGSIEARTGGGGIRVQRIAGPTQLQTVAGSIYLAGIQSQVRAVTSAGSITAYFASEAAGKKRGPSELECQQGDIEVYLPPGMALNIEAVIENATYHKVLTDPSLAAKVSDAEGAQGTRLRQEVSLNGGGELLRLRTVAGNILLLAAGSAEGKPVFRYVPKQMIELQEQHLRAMQAEIQRQVQEQIREKLRQEQEAHSRLNAFIQEQLRFLFARPLMVSGEEQSRKLEYQVKPRYPSAARRERIEGTVQLEAHVAEDGTVEKVRVLEGDPVLAEAAREAVMKWRYKPTLKNGKPVKVVTRVAVEFRMAK